MKKIYMLFIALAVSGCATVKVARYDKNISYPATDPASIEVFQKKPLESKFTEIGEVTVDGASSLDQVYRIFKIKAAESGGDAVYIYKTTERASTYIEPHYCHFYDGYYYPHRYYHYPYAGRHIPGYYYCYGYSDVRTSVFLTVVGIVIKYNRP